MVMALAQRRAINAVLVTELSRWGRSTLDLLQVAVHGRRPPKGCAHHSDRGIPIAEANMLPSAIAVCSPNTA